MSFELPFVTCCLAVTATPPRQGDAATLLAPRRNSKRQPGGPTPIAVGRKSEKLHIVPCYASLRRCRGYEQFTWTHAASRLLREGMESTVAVRHLKGSMALLRPHGPEKWAAKWK